MTDDLKARLRSQIGDDVQKIYDHEALFKAALARIEELEAERDGLALGAQWARNRLEIIADDAWHGDGRDLKRSIIGVVADFDEALTEPARYAIARAEAAEVALREAEAKALERAIECCAPHADDDSLDKQAKMECERAIRALIPQPETPAR